LNYASGVPWCFQPACTQFVRIYSTNSAQIFAAAKENSADRFKLVRKHLKNRSLAGT
jgi:hypothetical protein